VESGSSHARPQPNLLRAAMRHLFGISPNRDHFCQTLPVNPDAVRAVMLTHSTQPSEPARCAPFYPSSYCCNDDPALLDPPSQAA